MNSLYYLCVSVSLAQRVVNCLEGGMRIEALCGEDVEAVVALLREALPSEPITVARFAQKVLLDPNFTPQGALTAKADSGQVVGFLLALTRRHPLEEGPDDRNQGWITLF